MKKREFIDLLKSQVTGGPGGISEVRVDRLYKNNGVEKEALILLKAGSSVAAAVGTEELYREFLAGVPAAEIVGRLQCLMGTETFLPDERNPLKDYDDARSRLGVRLLNLEKNGKTGEECPFERVLDLMLAYTCRIELPGIPGATAMVRNCDLTRWGIDAGELKREALAQAAQSSPPELLQLERDASLVPWEGDYREERLFIILTNRARWFGAACVLYPGVLSGIAGRMGGDFYILPSSVHEVLLLPCVLAESAEVLRTMVREINIQTVLPEEILSDEVYRYDSEEDALVLGGEACRIGGA